MKKTEFFDLLMKSGNYGDMVITSITFHCTFSLLLGRAFKKVRGKYQVSLKSTHAYLLAIANQVIVNDQRKKVISKKGEIV